MVENKCAQKRLRAAIPPCEEPFAWRRPNAHRRRPLNAERPVSSVWPHVFEFAEHFPNDVHETIDAGLRSSGAVMSVVDSDGEVAPGRGTPIWPHVRGAHDGRVPAQRVSQRMFVRGERNMWDPDEAMCKRRWREPRAYPHSSNCASGKHRMRAICDCRECPLRAAPALRAEGKPLFSWETNLTQARASESCPPAAAERDGLCDAPSAVKDWKKGCARGGAESAGPCCLARRWLR